jgi:hypothetical protein
LNIKLLNTYLERVSRYLSVLKITDSKMTSTGATMPGLWFGNTIIDVWITSSEIITASGVLVVANYSQITQDFDYYASYLDNSGLLPAERGLCQGGPSQR